MIEFETQGGSGNPQPQEYNLTSPQNTISVTDVENGHEIDVNPTIIDSINNKQDKIIVGDFQTNAIMSMSLLEREGTVNAITNRVIGNYVPLLEIQCVNNGKSQFEFSVFSREDSMNYYGRYVLTTWNGSTPSCKFELLDYCNDNDNNVFSATNIVAIKLNPRERSNLARYLICKKIISTNGVLDAYFVNILSQDLGFCYSKKYYTRSPQEYYNPLEVIKITKSVTRWNWYFDYYFSWGNFAGDKGLQKEDEYKNNPTYAQTADLTNTDPETNDYVQYYYPTPSIIKYLTIDNDVFDGTQPKSITTRDWYANGIVGVDTNPYIDKTKVCLTIYKGSSMTAFDWSGFAFINFTTIDNNKIYWVYEAYKNDSSERTGYIIETPNNFN